MLPYRNFLQGLHFLLISSTSAYNPSLFGSSVFRLLSPSFSVPPSLWGDWLFEELWEGTELESTVVPKSCVPGVAVCMIFWRTSRIFSCRHTLVGKVSKWWAWKAAVAWAGEDNRDTMTRWTHCQERLDTNLSALLFEKHFYIVSLSANIMQKVISDELSMMSQWLNPKC